MCLGYNTAHAVPITYGNILNFFKTNIWSFCWNILQKMGSRNSSQMILQFQSTWKWILSRQPKFNKFLQSYLLATSCVSYFSTKKESVIIENSKLLMEKFGHFSWRPQKQRLIFIVTHFFLIFAGKEIFIQEYEEMDLKKINS